MYITICETNGIATKLVLWDNPEEWGGQGGGQGFGTGDTCMLFGRGRHNIVE